MDTNKDNISINSIALLFSLWSSLLGIVLFLCKYCIDSGHQISAPGVIFLALGIVSGVIHIFTKKKYLPSS